MSEKSNFIDLCVRGEASLEEVNDWVEQWHTGAQEQELYEYLGMSRTEYSFWVSGSLEALLFIVATRKENRRLVERTEEDP